MFYNHLKGAPVEMNDLGPQVRQESITMKLTADVAQYDIEEKSNVERNLLVGLWVYPAGRKIDQTYSSPTAAVLESAQLRLRHQTTDIYSNIPLEHVLRCNEQGRPYYVSLPGSVNLSDSSLYVADSGSIGANTAIRLQADFIKPTVR